MNYNTPDTCPCSCCAEMHCHCESDFPDGAEWCDCFFCRCERGEDRPMPIEEREAMGEESRFPDDLPTIPDMLARLAEAEAGAERAEAERKQAVANCDSWMAEARMEKECSDILRAERDAALERVRVLGEAGKGIAISGICWKCNSPTRHVGGLCDDCYKARPQEEGTMSGKTRLPEHVIVEQEAELSELRARLAEAEARAEKLEKALEVARHALVTLHGLQAEDIKGEPGHAWTIDESDAIAVCDAVLGEPK